MDNGYVLPAAALTVDGVPVPHEKIVQVDQQRGVIEDDREGDAIQGVAGDFDVHRGFRRALTR